MNEEVSDDYLGEEEEQHLLPSSVRGSINQFDSDLASLTGDDPEPVTLPEEEVQKEKGHSLGEKKIGNFLSFVFLINQIYGPGVLAIPIVFQQAGWFPTLVILTFFLVISSLSSTMLCEAIALIPGNRDFEKRIEYATAVKYYYGSRWHFVFQVFMNITLQSYNIASIIICAQSLDQFMLFLFDKTFALEFYPHPGFHSFTNIAMLYSSDVITISLGYLLICLMCIPMGMLNLDDNVKVVQTGSFIFLVVLLGEFIVYFIILGIGVGEHHQQRTLPAIGTNYAQLVSVFIFSWAYVMFVPSWVNEKKSNVNVNKIVWASGIASFFGYFFIGLLCAWAVPNLNQDDMLTPLSEPPTPKYTIIAAYLFSLGVIAPGIPVCSITTRYNLYVGKICGKKQSYFWGVLAPWVIGFIFSQGAIFAELLNWSSLIFNGIVNFLIPIFMYFSAVRAVRKRGDEDVASVMPLPKKVMRRAVPLAISLFGVTMMVIVIQIFVDFYYLAVLHQDLVG